MYECESCKNLDYENVYIDNLIRNRGVYICRFCDHKVGSEMNPIVLKILLEHIQRHYRRPLQRIKKEDGLWVYDDEF